MSIPRRIAPCIAPILRHRPPDRAIQSRFFAGNSKLLLVSTATTRPQLSFLTASQSQVLLLSRLNSRLFTSKTKRFLKEQWVIGKRWFVIWSAVSAFVVIEGMVILHELLEREFPTPPVWRWFNRARYHAARAFEVPEATRLNVPLWEAVGGSWKSLLKHLEDPKDEGAGLILNSGDVEMMPGITNTGFDITQKAEPWRRGYWEALMGCANAAERLYGSVFDKAQKLVIQADFMVGPSNPNPKPTPKWIGEAPKEEDCELAFEPPELYYERLLTTKGFTTKQRLETAIAYGDWLDFQGQHAAAEQIFRLGLDAALSPLAAPSDVVDSRSAIIRPSAPIVTENVLTAANALAMHNVQTGQSTAALSIFISVLRARRSCPVAPPAPPPKPLKRIDVSNQTDIGAFFTHVRGFFSIFAPIEYPSAPSSGDEPFERSPANECEEAALMSHLGELLFATSKRERAAGLRWTREAVQLADERAHDVRLSEGVRRKCIECIDVALGNWQDMIRLLQTERWEAQNNSLQRNSWASSFGSSGYDARRVAALKQQLVDQEAEFRRWDEKISYDGLKQKLESRGKPVWAFADAYKFLALIS